MVTVNGVHLEIDGTRLFDYLSETGYPLACIAAEYNGEILAPSQYGEVVLSDGDCLEIVRFVGGG